VRAVCVREFDQTRAIKVDAEVLYEVGILAGNYAAGFKPNLALIVIDIIDVANQPVALRNLVLHFAGNAIV
jgi:hypothetical protein